MDQLTTQLRFRMSEGGGECTYHLGINDDGGVEGITIEEYNETLLHLDDIARSCNYTITSIYEKDCGDNIKTTGYDKHNVNTKKVYELLIREHNPNKYIDIRKTNLKFSIENNVITCDLYNPLVFLLH